MVSEVMRTIANRSRVLTWVLLACIALGSLAMAQSQRKPVNAPARRLPGQHGGPSMKAVWVTRWDYRTADDVRRVIAQVAASGANTIFFQVRGEGTAYYNSKLEPWAWELTGNSPATTGKNPGWDPLALACREASARGIALHAYLNLMPGARGKSPPSSSGSLWTSKRSWFLTDSRNVVMDPEKHYAFLNPANPQVRAHLVALCREVVANYPIAGLHLDYVRWPGDYGDYGYDPTTLARFKRETGKTPANDSAWDQWRALQIETLVEAICASARQAKPGIMLSGSVISDPEAARIKHLQWSWMWHPRKSLDLIVPMNYADSSSLWESRARFFVSKVGVERLAMGLRASTTGKTCKARMHATRRMGVRHLALFAYKDLYPAGPAGGPSTFGADLARNGW